MRVELAWDHPPEGLEAGLRSQVVGSVWFPHTIPTGTLRRLQLKITLRRDVRSVLGQPYYYLVALRGGWAAGDCILRIDNAPTLLDAMEAIRIEVERAKALCNMFRCFVKGEYGYVE